MAITLEKRTAVLSLDVACDVTGGEEITPPGLIRRTLRVPTTRFGLLEIEEDLILFLPDGLIGFEHCKRYVVVRQEETSAFRWLQSLDEAAIAFPIVDPTEFRPDYAPTVADSDVRALELTGETPTLVFAIVTVPPHDPRAMTANLLGPLVINALTRRGKQVIIQDEGYTTRHRIVDELARTASLPPAPPKTKADRASQSAQAA